MAVTIRDVAKEAGVSTSTVSKVLNNWSSISPATCDRVHEAIRKLHYTPNARAVSFAKGASRNILFLSSLKKEEAYRNPHMFDILCGVRHTLAKQGYTLMLADFPEAGDPQAYLGGLIGKGIADGILIHGSCTFPQLARLLAESRFPHIHIGHPGPGSRMCWIDTNNGLAGQFAAQHMLECGYEKVAFIGERRTDHISTQRLNGFLGGMYDYGYRIPDEYIRYTDSSREDACRQTLGVLSLPVPPRAFICENNTLALGVFRRKPHSSPLTAILILPSSIRRLLSSILTCTIWESRLLKCCCANWTIPRCWCRPIPLCPYSGRGNPPCRRYRAASVSDAFFRHGIKSPGSLLRRPSPEKGRHKQGSRTYSGSFSTGCRLPH